jgi:hypothetical protein
MTRSQGHKVRVQGYASNGSEYEEGVAGGGLLLPVLTSIAPTTGVVNNNVTVTATGTNFDTTAKVCDAGRPLATTFVSATSLTAVLPTGGTGNVTKNITVQNGPYASVSKPFTVTLTELAREFPLGPYNLLRIEPIDTGGGTYVLDASSEPDIQLGDTVRIEATGSTPANGDYVVESVSVSGNEMYVIVSSEVGTPIEAKGRISVLAHEEA